MTHGLPSLTSFNFLLPVPPNDPEIQNGPIVHVISNIPYNLSCRASGAKPAAEISWYRDGQRQDSAVYSKVSRGECSASGGGKDGGEMVHQIVAQRNKRQQGPLL